MTLERAAEALAEGAGEFACIPPTTGIAEKVAFLSRPDAYPHRVDAVVARETHMSWVFLAGPCVYKLKKPVRFPYLDFSTLARRDIIELVTTRIPKRFGFDPIRDIQGCAR